MKAVISGMNGFIGQHLAKRLMKEKCLPVSLDRNLLLNTKRLREFLEEEKPDYIFHLAAYGNHSSQTDDFETFAANVCATYTLLHASRDIPYKAFVNFGTSSEYGKKLLPMREEDLPEPETMYAATKVAGTYLARAFAKKYNKPIVTVRPFSVYGDGEADFRFIPMVINRSFDGKVLQLDANAVHDWIFVEDFIDGVLKVVDNIDALQGQAINIGTGRQFTNKQIVEELSVISNKFIKTNKTYLRPNDSNVWMANINTLKILGWKPKHTLSEGLEKTYRYYERKLKHN